MEENKLSVMYGDNKNLVIDVVDIIKNETNGKEYVIYNIDGNEDEFFMSEIEETDNTVTLKEIQDETIKNELEEYIMEMSKETSLEGE